MNKTPMSLALQVMPRNSHEREQLSQPLRAGAQRDRPPPNQQHHADGLPCHGRPGWQVRCLLKSNSADCVCDDCLSIEQTQTSAFYRLLKYLCSERLDRSHAEGQRRTETCAINQSLSSLVDVFEALASRAAHVPYRNSKLTYLLKPALSPGGKALMVVNVSPEPSSAYESLTSMRLATKVRMHCTRWCSIVLSVMAWAVCTLANRWAIDGCVVPAIAELLPAGGWR